MKRDMDLILRILRYVRDAGSCDGFARHPDFAPDHTRLETEYHVDLCIEAGLLKSVVGTRHGTTALKLTWAGHDKVEQHNDC